MPDATLARTRLTDFWNFLTRPNPRVPLLKRARSRMLAILLMFTLPVAWLTSEWGWTVGQNKAFQLAVPVVFLTIYLVNRAGYFRLAVWLCILALVVRPLLYLLTTPVSSVGAVTFGAIWLVAPILVCYVLLSVRDFVLTLLLVLGVIIAVLLLNSAVTFATLSIALLLLFWTAALLLVASVLRRDDVRSQLAHNEIVVESEARYRTLFSATLDGIVVHRNGIVVDCNRAFADLTGYTEAELKGMPALELYAPEERERAVHWMQSSLPYQTQGMRKDGSRYWASVHGQPIMVNGQAMRIATVTDITQRKEAEQQQVRLSIEQEKVQVLQRFIDNLSHDLRTPLSTINTGLYLIRKMKDDPERLDAQVVSVQEQVSHLVRLIDDMLVMSTLDRRATGEYKFAWRDINAVIALAVEEETSQALRKRQTLTFEGAEGLPEALLDTAEFRRLMKHLIQNAINFTPDGGTITVTTSSEDEEIVVSVTDTGIGISTKDRPLIFDYFYRADTSRSPETGGTGLGLTIARRITDAHNGRIEVESTPGLGSTFRVRLPVTRRRVPTIDLS
ncbi:MAG: PAS domain-containing sensor histidine kinase [Anaerolineae bacterium]